MPRVSVTFVIMAGGRGERLWPLVRAATPKVCLAPDGGRMLLQATIDRLRPAWPGARWLVITTQEQAAAVRAGLPSSLRRGVVVEPQIKNTAACLTLAAAVVAVDDPRRVVVAVPADHWIGDAEGFRRSVRAAILSAAAQETLAMIGVRPTHAKPGLGYLWTGPRLRGAWGARVFRLARFVEKPSPAAARRLLKRPRTYWNSGIFVGRADAFLEQLTTWLPEHARRLIPLAEGWRRSSWNARARRAYEALEPISFDHGVMDHLAEGLVVEGRFPWADLGSWDAWARLARVAPTVAIDSRGLTVVSQEPHLVAAIGVHNLVVVHTPSATLLCPPERAQQLRDVVRRLNQEARFARYR